MTAGAEKERSWVVRWFRGMQSHRFDILLLALAVLMVAAPLVHAVWPIGHPILTHIIMLAVFGVMMVSTVLAVCQTPRTSTIALSLAIPGFTLDVIGLLADHDGLATVGHLFEIAFLVFAIVVILRYLFSTESVSLNMIWASLCVYLLLAVLWGNAYSLVDILEHDQNSFLFANVDGDQQGLMRFGSGHTVYSLYFSIVTMTTLGYGDIVPITPATRMLAALEALTGQLYLTVLVARLVGLHISQSVAKKQGTPTNTSCCRDENEGPL